MDILAQLAVALAAYFLAGLVTGVIAGLLGVGGGLIMIPVLNALFLAQGVPLDIVQHLALGTSLAAIVPTGMLSARGHAARAAVEWSPLRSMAPWIGLGALLTALAARDVSSLFLQSLYVLLCLWVLYTLVQPDKRRDDVLKPLKWPRAAAFTIGAFSGVLGIGGGSLTTPYLLRHGRDIRMAVGTAAALGVPIALAGSLGYIFGGLQAAGRPASAVGFVDMQAVLGLFAGGMLSTRWGVALAHRWPRTRLKQMFGLVMLLAGGKMAWQIAGRLL